MGQTARKFEVIEGGSPIPALRLIDDRIDDPLVTTGKWLSGDDLAALAQIAPRVAKRAIAAGRWRGSELMVRKVEVGRGGAGGVVPQVHVDSLPADLREAWYAARGIALHERLDPATGEMRMVPDEALRNDARWDERTAVARWRMDLIRSITLLPKGSAERKARIDDLASQLLTLPGGKTRRLGRATIYTWIRAFAADGIGGLMPDERKDKGVKKVVVTRVWDGFFAGRISVDDHRRVGDEVLHYIRSLWASGESGWRAICEKSTTRLIEISRDLRDVRFDALPLGVPGPRAIPGSQFGICCVNRRLAEAQRSYGLIAVRDKDNARYQDTIAPTIRRDYSQLKPREIVVGDVHPTDIMVLRADGSRAYPKAISWFDPATNEIFMVLVLLEQREGVRREHIAMAFEAMVAKWGLPKLLYLDNGSEYQWAEMMDGFTQLSKLAGLAVKEYGEGSLADARVADARQAVVRSLAYNAKGKPGIEGAFGNLERVFFSNLLGWTAGDRMRKKTHAKGRDPVPFPGTMTDFMDQIGTALDWYHKRPQYGRLDGKSPNEALRTHIEGGWGKVALANPDVLALAFSTVEERVVDRGTVQYGPRDGRSQRFFCEALLAWPGARITIRVPAYDPRFLFCFAPDGELIGIARPEQTFHPLDPAGAREGAARGKFLRRHISQIRENVAMLDLVVETARHAGHLPAAPEAPIAALVSTPMLDRMKEMDAEERARLAAPEEARREAMEIPAKTVVTAKVATALSKALA